MYIIIIVRKNDESWEFILIVLHRSTFKNRVNNKVYCTDVLNSLWYSIIQGQSLPMFEELQDFLFSFMGRKAHHMCTFWAISFTAALSSSVHNCTGSVTLESTTLFLLSKGHAVMHWRDLSARVRANPLTLRYITHQQY